MVAAVRRHEASTALFRPKRPSAKRPNTAEPVNTYGQIHSEKLGEKHLFFMHDALTLLNLIYVKFNILSVSF